MKKILALILIFAMLLCAVPACFADGAVHITDAEGLAAIASAPDKEYVLDNDIDLAGIDWDPVPLTGSFDGCGYTIYNLTVSKVGKDTATTYDGNKIPYITSFAALFSTVVGAEISNVNILGAYVDVEPDVDAYAAILAGFVYESELSDCTVQGRVYFYGHATVCGQGGVAGFAYGNFNNCDADVELFFEDRCVAPITAEQFMGGLFATGISNSDFCDIKIDGYASCNGHVHTGGLGGLHYELEMPEYWLYRQYNRNTTVNGQISFYECHPVRRAYCAGLFGENLIGSVDTDGNEITFERNETFDYSRILSPEKCDSPVYDEKVTEPTCEEWGYTDHTCSGCGYHWRDSYTAPSHTAGEWITTTQSTYDIEGEKTCYCADCGIVMDTEPIEKLIRTTDVVLNAEGLEMTSGATYVLTAEVYPDNAYNKHYTWSSDDRSIAAVDENGLVTARYEGTTVIRCTCDDGTESVCTVTVEYTTLQWVIMNVLFGEYWYMK